jgi:hypothetical protein
MFGKIDPLDDPLLFHGTTWRYFQSITRELHGVYVERVGPVHMHTRAPQAMGYARQRADHYRLSAFLLAVDARAVNEAGDLAHRSPVSYIAEELRPSEYLGLFVPEFRPDETDELQRFFDNIRSKILRRFNLDFEPPLIYPTV